MSKLKAVTVISYLCSLLACQPKENVFIGCKEIIQNATAFDSAKSDPFDIQALSIAEDCLLISIVYGGGCGEVGLELFTNGKVIYTLPPKMELTPVFADKDNCEALVSETYSFDLEPFQSGENGELILRIKGFDQQITYTW